MFNKSDVRIMLSVHCFDLVSVAVEWCVFMLNCEPEFYSRFSYVKEHA